MRNLVIYVLSLTNWKYSGLPVDTPPGRGGQRHLLLSLTMAIVQWLHNIFTTLMSSCNKFELVESYFISSPFSGRFPGLLWTRAKVRSCCSLIPCQTLKTTEKMFKTIWRQLFCSGTAAGLENWDFVTHFSYWQTGIVTLHPTPVPCRVLLPRSRLGRKSCYSERQETKTRVF